MGCGQPPKPNSRKPGKVQAAAFHDLNTLKRHQHQHTDHDRKQQPNSKKPRQQAVTFNPLCAPFRTFKTQQAAFDFLDKQTCSCILRTFACETAVTGQREFIVTSAEVFWQHYIALPLSARHHYEIIRQGTPCHLYFDLEYHPDCNPHLDGPALVEVLLSGVRDLLWQLYGIPWDPAFVVELDSSTDSKFSRHLIVRLPGLAFADVCHAGRFARCVLLHLLHQGQHCSKPGALLVLKREGGLTSFVDMGVYTRNRAFRLYLSSKFGKTAVLRLTHRFCGATICPKAAFHASLVSVLHKTQSPAPPAQKGSSNATAQSAATAAYSSGSGSSGSSRRGVARPLSLLRVEDDGQQQLLSLPPAWRQVAMLQLRPLEHICSSNNNDCSTGSTNHLQGQLLPAIAGVTAGPASVRSTLVQQQPYCGLGLGQQHAGALLQSPSQPCFGPSPFPLLDKFISSVCCVGGVQGEIRSWLVQAGSSCVVFNIKHNRWCGNVGRPHKSNGIFFCVDLAAGVYYQKCYDPECRQYRSNYMPLPADAWHAYRHLLQAPQAAGPQQQMQCTAAAASFAAPAGATSTQLDTVQQQGAGCVTAAQPPADVDDDEQCLQLLLQFEQQQQQHCCQGLLHQHADRCPSHADCLQQQQDGQADRLASPADGVHDTVSDDDDDELMVQLLQEVEQRVAPKQHTGVG